MAFPTDTFTAADLDVLIPEVWGSRINDFFKENLILGDFFTNRSDELMGGGDVLHTPNIAEMTANTKVNATAVTLNSPTETKIDLTVDTWDEVSFMIEDVEAAQVKKSYNIQQTYARNAAFTVATKIEVALASLFSGFTGSVGASTTNVADSEIRAAISVLETNAVPFGWNGREATQVAFFFHPNTFWRQLQGIDKFSLAQNSPVNDPTAKKPAGYLYGIPVFTSPNIQAISGGNTGRWNALAHKDALHWATLSLPQTKNSYVGQYGVRVQTNYIPEYLGFLTTADVVHGEIENRDGAGVRILTHFTAV